MSKKNLSEPQELCEAVAGWLSYKSLTGLRGHLNEASISVPLTEYLTTKYGSEIESEREHPLFRNSKRGRPKQVDFVRTKRNDKKWHAAYECKFQSDTPARLLSDICRLLCLSQARDTVGTPHRYFVLAGKRKDADTPLDRQINSSKGKRISVFQNILVRTKEDFSKRNTFRMSELDPSQLQHFCNFAADNKVKLPSVSTTNLRGLAIAANYSCAIWEIKSAMGSKLLSHKELLEMQK